jgi:S1-C subfamily serine protease
MRMLSILFLLLPAPALAQRLIPSKGTEKESFQPAPELIPLPRSETDPVAATVVIERGTGFIVGDRGLVVTASHVVAGKTPEIRLKSGKVLTTTIAHFDKALDLLVLQVAESDLPLLPRGLVFGDAAKAGDRVSFIGHPNFKDRRYEWSHSSGVVAATGRTIPMPTGEKIGGMIQLDANVNTGNSGGPVLDAGGRVVGCVVAYDASASGIGFALNGRAIEQAVKGVK